MKTCTFGAMLRSLSLFNDRYLNVVSPWLFTTKIGLAGFSLVCWDCEVKTYAKLVSSSRLTCSRLMFVICNAAYCLTFRKLENLLELVFLVIRWLCKFTVELCRCRPMDRVSCKMKKCTNQRKWVNTSALYRFF